MSNTALQPGRSRTERVLDLAEWGAGLFILLTFAAMWFYPGGTLADPTTRGYSFFENFFSDLGFHTAQNGAANPVAAALFFTAILLAGTSLVLFFFTFWCFFQQPLSLRLVSGLGTLVGTMSGLCFVAVAFAPADLYRGAHIFFVTWAFRLFPLAVSLYAVAIFAHPTYPRRYGWLLVGFTVCLVGYVLLLDFGPPAYGSALGQYLQVVGQKVIVYCCILSVIVQAHGAKKFIRSR